MKLRNTHGELLFVEEIFHEISTVHLAYFAVQVHARSILVMVAWSYYRLLAYYAVPFHFPVCAIAVENVPVAAYEPYGIYSKVCDGDAVSEQML